MPSALKQFLNKTVLASAILPMKPGPHLRILLVEPSRIGLAMMTRMLAACGHEVMAETDGAEALRRLKNTFVRILPDAIVLRHRLPSRKEMFHPYRAYMLDTVRHE